MKKFIIIFSIFLFVSFNLNVIPISAQPPGTFSQGIYKISDLKLLLNVEYAVQNVSPAESFLIIFDSNKRIEQSIRLEGNSIKYVLKPMEEDYSIIIFGDGQLDFTPVNPIT
ncbi:hypothetical protein [Clostridium sp. BL-8]|uniref:hypothetical protein n=1 Tax=Clostridium sp. BL-8 TaxID=349938 RepID=UPI00098CC544|nr:hypothetical protein [Clostridium sp. BL-8]OOM80036.1 hypothetical protein CLOBL_10840 [Clostridium sp. BL-8]